MKVVLTYLWQGLKAAAGFIFPVFARARGSQTLGRAVFWALHLVLLGLVLVGLYLLNRWLHLDAFVGTDYAWLREGFLPILFLLVYALGWLGWWLWKLLLPGEEESAFPDIDKAWDEAMDALRQAGIGLSDAPLFLVLGRPAGREELLFEASHLAFDVKQVPPRRDAPLHVYANRDGIYVTCPGASLLGRQAAILAGEVGEAPPDVDDRVEQSTENATLRPEQQPMVRAIKDILARAQKQGRGYDQLTPEERREIARLERQDRPRPSLLKDSTQADELTARLAHLCRLIVRDRYPYCPVNGILLLFPLAATETSDLAGQTGDVCRRDLGTVRRVFRVHCPLLALLGDLQTATGFHEFVGHFSQKQREQRLGQRFPHVADVPPEELPRAVDDMTAWLCHSVLPTWVYKNLQVEMPGKEAEREGLVRANGLLCRFLNEMRERKPHLSLMLRRALPIDAGGPLLFGGCYLAGTGADAGQDQAFVRGVFSRLTKEQGVLLWADEALAEDQAGRRWATWGYSLLVLVAGALVLGAGAHYFLGGRRRHS
jgi:hypothetical protein